MRGNHLAYAATQGTNVFIFGNMLPESKEKIDITIKTVRNP